jgi:hypothetical protein
MKKMRGGTTPTDIAFAKRSDSVVSELQKNPNYQKENENIINEQLREAEKTFKNLHRNTRAAAEAAEAAEAAAKAAAKEAADANMVDKRERGNHKQEKSLKKNQYNDEKFYEKAFEFIQPMSEVIKNERTIHSIYHHIDQMSEKPKRPSTATKPVGSFKPREMQAMQNFNTRIRRGTPNTNGRFDTGPRL